MCGSHDETVQHTLCSCPKLAQTEYKKRHDVVGRFVHWELCKEYGVECSDKWCEHSPKSIEKNEEVKLLWDFAIQTDRGIHHRRPDIVISRLDREKESWWWCMYIHTCFLKNNAVERSNLCQVWFPATVATGTTQKLEVFSSMCCL